MRTKVDKAVFSKLYSDDIIYHYTKAATAIDFILYNKELRFSSRLKSIDPIEKEILRYVGIGTEGLVPHSEQNKKKRKDNSEISIQLKEELQNKAHSYQQICFCKNNLKRGDFYRFIAQAEEFGFTKPRMWDQYGDKYRGVCIAFSKSKLLEKNKDLKYVDSDISYQTYNELGEKNDYVNILKADDKKYQAELFDKLEKDIFIKHKDYEGENEYRICVAEQTNAEMGESSFLKIDGCIEAIIISSYANQHQRIVLKEYAVKNGIPYFAVIWEEKEIALYNEEFFKDEIDKMYARPEEKVDEVEEVKKNR